MLLATEEQVEAFNKYAVGALGTRREIRDLFITYQISFLKKATYDNLSFPLGLSTKIDEVKNRLRDMYGELESI
jgi:hypothetical protein